MKRRSFIKNSIMGASALATTPLLAHSYQEKALKISLAQWSLHRNFWDGKLDAIDFASIARETYNINAVEYVNGLYPDKGGDEVFWNKMKVRSDDVGVKNLVMMVDDEGDLGSASEKKRLQAVENHYKWIHAAKLLGCHTMRVNAFGDSDREIFRMAIMDGMSRLADYAAELNINIVI